MDQDEFMAIDFDVTHELRRILGNRISGKVTHRRSEFILSIDADQTVTLNPPLRIRVESGCHRATVDLVEHVLATDIPRYEGYVRGCRWFGRMCVQHFVLTPGRWAFRFGDRKRRRWERID